jgi:hypothetical protein
VGHAQLVELEWVQNKLGAEVRPISLADVTEGLFVESVRRQALEMRSLLRETKSINREIKKASTAAAEAEVVAEANAGSLKGDEASELLKAVTAKLKQQMHQRQELHEELGRLGGSDGEFGAFFQYKPLLSLAAGDPLTGGGGLRMVLLRGSAP